MRGVGELEVQVAGFPDDRLPAQLDLDAVHDHGPGAGGQGHRLRRVTGDGDQLALVHVSHLAPLPELGVHHVRPGGRERHLDLQLTGASGRLGVHVGERAEVLPGWR